MKKELRIKLKELRDSLSDKDRRSEKIADAFIESEFFKNSDTVLLYYSTGSEVSTMKIFEACLADNKKIAFPVCIDADGTMDFYTVKDKSDLEVGMYGIVAPKKNCEKLIPDENAVCLVPGIAFDRHGYRLGYGKGYYDRYLSRFPLISIGLSYELLLCGKLPTGDFDKKVSYIITEKYIYKINSKEDLKNG